jgi:TPR repeat protein
MLKLSFKFYPDDRAVRTPLAPGNRDKRSTAMRRTERNNGEAKMAHIELALAMPELVDAEDCFGLGMNYSSGAGVAVDLVQAHMWFNIAAMRGHRDGASRRKEIAELMSDSEIGCAQRAARDWLKSHPQAPIPVPAAVIRVAA